MDRQLRDAKNNPISFMIDEEGDVIETTPVVIFHFPFPQTPCANCSTNENVRAYGMNIFERRRPKWKHVYGLCLCQQCFQKLECENIYVFGND
jgi:hypothetical protein